jgi:uncharacterized protein YjbI with pentapeptide repeats
VTGAVFAHTASQGFTQAQLYSTASYQTGDLRSIDLGSNDRTGWNLANQNMTGASLSNATLTNVDLSGRTYQRGLLPGNATALT